MFGTFVRDNRLGNRSEYAVLLEAFVSRPITFGLDGRVQAPVHAVIVTAVACGKRVAGEIK